MHNCTVSAASGPLHYDKRWRRLPRPRPKGSILLMTIMTGRTSEEARVCARSLARIPGIEMMENGKKNDFATTEIGKKARLFVKL